MSLQALAKNGEQYIHAFIQKENGKERLSEAVKEYREALDQTLKIIQHITNGGQDRTYDFYQHKFIQIMITGNINKLCDQAEKDQLVVRLNNLSLKLFPADKEKAEAVQAYFFCKGTREQVNKWNTYQEFIASEHFADDVGGGVIELLDELKKDPEEERIKAQQALKDQIPALEEAIEWRERQLKKAKDELTKLNPDPWHDSEKLKELQVIARIFLEGKLRKDRTFYTDSSRELHKRLVEVLNLFINKKNEFFTTEKEVFNDKHLGNILELTEIKSLKNIAGYDQEYLRVSNDINELEKKIKELQAQIKKASGEDEQPPMPEERVEEAVVVAAPNQPQLAPVEKPEEQAQKPIDDEIKDTVPPIPEQPQPAAAEKPPIEKKNDPAVPPVVEQPKPAVESPKAKITETTPKPLDKPKPPVSKPQPQKVTGLKRVWQFFTAPVVRWFKSLWNKLFRS